MNARLEALVRRVHPDGVLLKAAPLLGGISATLTKLRVKVADRDVQLVLRQADAAASSFACSRCCTTSSPARPARAARSPAGIRRAAVLVAARSFGFDRLRGRLGRRASGSHAGLHSPPGLAASRL
ncbi:MAG: hypothetical protein M0Z54_11070 [Thermaerobacter sp.]|nr:hypothetical protein [Thermaerobacter sp.]